MADEEKKNEEQPESEATMGPEGQEPPQQQQTTGRQIRLNFKDIEPQYANFCSVMLGQDEVFFNFAKVFGVVDEVKIDSQIFMNVRNAKRLLLILQRLIEQYEAKHGVLEVRT